MAAVFLMIFALAIAVCAGETKPAASAPSAASDSKCHIDIPEI